MGEDVEECAVQQPVSHPPDAVVRVGGRVEDQAIAKALAARASTSALRKLRREERLNL
jgi:hypothetical protein